MKDDPLLIEVGPLMDFIHYFKAKRIRISNFLPLSSGSGELQSDDRALASTTTMNLSLQGMKHLLEPEVIFNFVTALEVT